MNENIITEVQAALDGFEGVAIHHNPAVIPSASGKFLPLESLGLEAAVQNFVLARFPSGLFTHQHRAIENILRGENTVVATRTSSGKSLIFSVPVLNSLCRDKNATSLFLYPQKALANDQLLKLRESIESIGVLAKLAKSRKHLVSRYDGATDDDDKAEIRSTVQLLLTNPDMLHRSMLQWHERHWARFFSNLKHVIVDECHEYRGIFGTNVAYILRRVRALCEFYGSNPTYIATSATVAEPTKHLETLSGVPFTCIGPDDDGSRQGKRKFWMVSGSEHFYDFGRKLTMHLAEQGLSVLTFCPSRLAAERLMSRTAPNHPGEPDYVRVYRAGLSPEDREEIEGGLREKTVRAVYATSALELGIDIGAIDVVICIGLPHSMMSLWQRAGRAARGGKDGAIVLIPGETPIDSYYASHPVEFFARDHEPLVLSLGNRRVVHQQYACAQREIGGDENKLAIEIFGEPFEVVRRLRSEGKLDDVEIFYNSEPHMEVNIRSMGEGAYALELDKTRIGEIDSFHLLREAYRNAVYRHGGLAYRVQAIKAKDRKVILRREFSYNETTPYIQKQIKLKRRYSTSQFSRVTVATVAIDVTEFLANVVEKDRSGNTVQNWLGSGGMRQNRLPTDGTMIQLHSDTWASIVASVGQQAASSALRSCERLLWSLFPTVSGPCDTQDVSAASHVTAGGEAEIFLYDLVYDGADLAICAYDRIGELLVKAHSRLTTCDCQTDEGCFRCIANPRIPEPTSKAATSRILEQLVSVVTSESPKVSEQSRSFEEKMTTDERIKCAKCDAVVMAGHRFCHECGEPIL